MFQFGQTIMPRGKNGGATDLEGGDSMARSATVVMQRYDTNKDGDYSHAEVKQIVRELLETRDAMRAWQAAASNWRRVGVSLLAVLVVWLAITLSMSLAAISLTKDTIIVDGVLIRRGGNVSNETDVVGTRDARYAVQSNAELSYAEWREAGPVTSNVAEIEVALGTLTRFPPSVQSHVTSIFVPAREDEEDGDSGLQSVFRFASLRWFEVDRVSRLIVHAADGSVLSVEGDVAGHLAPASGAPSRFCAAEAVVVVHNQVAIKNVIDIVNEYADDVNDAGGCDDFYDWLEDNVSNDTEPWVNYDASRRRGRRELAASPSPARQRRLAARRLTSPYESGTATSQSSSYSLYSSNAISDATSGYSSSGTPSTDFNFPG